MFRVIKGDRAHVPSFVDDVLVGRATLQDIDDYIDRWHDAPPDSAAASMELHEFLGLTWDEYRLWGEKPHSLRFSIIARRNQVTVDEILEANLVGAAARAGEESDAEDVLSWLRDRGRLKPTKSS